MEVPMAIYVDPPGGGDKTAAAATSKTLPSSSSSTNPVGGEHDARTATPSSLDPQGTTAAAAPAAPCMIPPRRFTPDGRVTSVDLTPDGAYVIAGCSDGTIRLYSMLDSSWGREGLLLGQIHAKGLITNLLFHVEVADDGRFAFAGVLRGSVEMFAYDLTRLPKGPWGDDDDTNSFRGHHDDFRLSKAEAETLIECHTNLDAKLRGFGAVTRVSPTSSSSSSFRTGDEMDLDDEPPEYRLICGLGIKNLHIWRFQEGRGGEDTAPTWECIFDLASNGMSIELLAVRAGGLEAVSKSCGQNLRVWDLSSAEEKEKAPYTDVLNTQDTRAVFGDYAFGGTCQLSLVRLDACKQLNRMELPLPTTASAGGKAKRRQLCSVKDVVGTHGGGAQGGRVLIICSDGGVHCYESTGASSATGRLVPVHSLTVEEEDDMSFYLASVGKGEKASPVVLQTRWLTGESCGEIYVAPLQLAQPKEEAVAIRRKALGQLDHNRLAGGSAAAGAGLTKAKVGVAKGLSNSSSSSRDNSNSGSNAGNASGGNNAPGSGGKGGAGLTVSTSNSSSNNRADSPSVTQPLAQSKKPHAKKRAKSLSGGASLPPLGPESSTTNSKTSAAAAAAASKENEGASTAAVPPGPLVLCKPLSVRRPPPVAPLLLPIASSTASASAGKVPASYYPIKRRHYDPFAAMTKPKRGKNHFEGPPKAMRDLEAKRLAEDGGSKTQEFFKERVARQEALRDMRLAMEQQARQVRLAATTTSTTSDSREGGKEGGREGEGEREGGQASSMVDVGPFSTVVTWGGLREKHRRDKEDLATKFRAEHDWLRSRFLEAVERERLLFHIHKHALPSSVRDPIGFLWWHNSRLPVKKQWGRYRAFPQQSLEVQALTGLPDVSGRRFSLSGIIANYRDLAARTVRRQQVEADTLAAMQSMDLPFARPPALKVVYPYLTDFAVQDPLGEQRKEEQEAKAREATGTAVVETTTTTTTTTTTAGVVVSETVSA